MILDRAQEICRQIEKLQAELVALNQYGGDEYELGAVLRFQVRYGIDAKAYRYAAVKTDGGWFVTGGDAVPQGVGWNELIRWGIEHHMTGLAIASAWSTVRG